MKLLKSKRAVNDISIATGIILVFVLLGVLLPFVNDAFDVEGSDINTQSLETNVGEEIENINSIGAFTVLLSVLKMFFWTFGDLPFWLDAIFLVFRIMLALIIARNVWIGGGG
ncbi:hypothetical protein LCGC14_1065190 [marine sediment metagenome]|uniref:Uncharacterized protein n=1 Tax=marine sediment metagenome TaxID=412755 RepID=A0A0F9N6V7_9ZZZZ